MGQAYHDVFRSVARLPDAPTHVAVRPNLTLAVLALVGLVYALLQSLVAPALPTIQRELGTSESGVFPMLVALVLLAGLLKGVLSAARSITPVVTAIEGVAQAASKDLDAVIALVTTQNYISQIVGSVANYGGSLDVALPDKAD